MRAVFTADLEEIRESSALRWYGAFLSLVHLFSFLYFTQKNVPRMLSRGSDTICWPFFENCTALRPLLTEGFVRGYLGVYLAIAIVAALAFPLKRTVKIGYVLLIVLNVAKFALYAQDYRMMGNYHYMPYVSSIAFLVLPDKLRLARFLLVGYYFSAGTLKLNYEWLSGEAMIRAPFISGKLLELACAYVVVMELVLVFGLLSRRREIFWATIAQLGLFHAFSWHIVGFFYPCIMACLLSAAVLARFAPERGPARAPWSTPAAIALFAAAQLAPSFFPGDPAVSGQGRIFALNMFDARAQCENLIVAREGDAQYEVSRPTSGARLAVRVRCDPVVYFNWARNLCRENAGVDGFDVDVYLISKRTTDREYRPMLAIEGFCSRDLGYDIFAPNEWILR